jgi:hypothetical protein
MPMFGRKRQSPADLRALTATVKERDECWRVSWLGDGSNEPPEYEATSLTEVIELATSGALAECALGRRTPGAILTFAIYPRGSGEEGLLYEISGRPGQFKARSVEDGARQVQAANLEELVAGVRQEARPDYAMLCWVRPLAELPTE